MTIQTATETRNSFGEPDKAWAKFADCWASIRPIQGDESFLSQRIHADVTHRIVIRYLSGITPQMRVLFGTRAFGIRSIRTVDEINHTMVLEVVENG